MRASRARTRVLGLRDRGKVLPVSGRRAAAVRLPGSGPDCARRGGQRRRREGGRDWRRDRCWRERPRAVRRDLWTLALQSALNRSHPAEARLTCNACRFVASLALRNLPPAPPAAPSAGPARIAAGLCPSATTLLHPRSRPPEPAAAPNGRLRSRGTVPVAGWAKSREDDELLVRERCPARGIAVRGVWAGGGGASVRLGRPGPNGG